MISQFVETGHNKVKEYERNTFVKTYTNADILLLAKTDELHDYPNGAALSKILKRMVNISKISVTHIYNLRHTPVYLRSTLRYEKTKPTTVSLGERRKPQPEGKSGYLR